jgi:Fe-S cluster assembly protein SufD
MSAVPNPVSPAPPSPAVARFCEAYDRLRSTLPGPTARRDSAIARFAELGFPHPREEAWKYTNLRRLESRKFAPAMSAPRVLENAPAPLVTPHLVIVNGQLATATAERLAGFDVRTIERVDATRREELLRVLPVAGAERFAELNAALTLTPVLTEMPGDTVSDEVLQISLHTTGTEPTLASPRLVVRMGPNSRGRLLLEHTDDGRHEHFTNAVIDLELAPGSELTLYRLQRQHERAFHLERIESRVADGARFTLRDAQLGGSLARLDLEVALAGRAAATELTGVFLADGSRHLDTHARVGHRAIETTSLQDYRGIAANRGRGVFNGKAVVHAGAQKSNARQVNRNLLLTPGAEIDAKPDLEIYADDVQCSHGTTTGQLDPGALFYLRSRGLDEAEARSALTRAFAGPVLARVDLAEFATFVHDELDRRLLGLLEGVA